MKKVGITASAFDLFHAGHIVMLKECKKVCDYLIVALQTDPTIDRSKEKNKPAQSIVERQVQVGACRYVDEIIVYETEQELEEILSLLDIDVRIIGADWKDKEYTGKKICEERGIEIYFNERHHKFSTTELRRRAGKW